MALNVNRNVDDAFYRYKMPRLLAKVEGKGNGIKTVIANMPEIAKALNRPPTYPTKYFGCELGAQTQVDTKNDRYIVNGEHDASRLQELLDGFIKKFVLCPACENPETKLSVKRNVINQKCIACGHSLVLNSKHRLITYIVKNPPVNEVCENGSAAGKRDRRNKKSKGDGGNGESGESPLEGAEVNGDNNEDNNSDELNDDEDWLDDPDEAEQRRLELAGGMAGLTMNEDLEKTIEERLDIFYNFVKKMAKGTTTLDAKAVAQEAERLDCKEKGVLPLCRIVFNENVLQQVKPNRPLFLKFTVGNTKAQKYLLGGIEQLITEHKDALLNKTPLILKAFYDADILEEEVIIGWGEKSSKRYVSKEENELIRSKAEPFVTWLQEAEEESSEDEDDVVIEYEDEKRAKMAEHAAKTKAILEGRAPAEDSEESEEAQGEDIDGINIDDI